MHNIIFADEGDIRKLWGPVVTTTGSAPWVGAAQAASNTSELSDVHHALKWVWKGRSRFPPQTPAPTHRINPVAKKRMITRNDGFLDRAKKYKNEIST